MILVLTQGSSRNWIKGTFIHVRLPAEHEPYLHYYSSHWDSCWSSLNQYCTWKRKNYFRLFLKKTNKKNTKGQFVLMSLHQTVVNMRSNTSRFEKKEQQSSTAALNIHPVGHHRHLFHLFQITFYQKTNKVIKQSHHNNRDKLDNHLSQKGPRLQNLNLKGVCWRMVCACLRLEKQKALPINLWYFVYVHWRNFKSNIVYTQRCWFIKCSSMNIPLETVFV